jgi:S-adenosylmethionine:tRNA ribosyltransferase-isomerase
MRVDAFDYELPPELIAQRPAAERGGARLLVVGRAAVEHRAVADLAELVPEGALIVANDTRVMRARLLGQKVGSGGKTEILLVRREGTVEPEGRLGERWRAMGRASKPLREGAEIDCGEVRVVLRGRTEGGLFEVDLFSRGGGSVEEAIERSGHVPLPPYIKRADDAADAGRYQTVFARVPGAVAAPTAGLHLHEALLARMRERGCEIATVTLHVGLGTFQPVTVDDLDDHPMHAERFEVSRATASAVARARERGAPVVAVGTTVVRALESAVDARRPGAVRPCSEETHLLVQPGYDFKVVDRLLTNFHLPRSTLLALACAFGGTERVLSAYKEAVRARYRFFSYGDAMLLERGS